MINWKELSFVALALSVITIMLSMPCGSDTILIFRVATIILLLLIIVEIVIFAALRNEKYISDLKSKNEELLIKSYERDSYKQMVNDDAKLRKDMDLYLNMKKLMTSETGSSKPSEKNLSDLLNEFDEFRKRIR